MNLKTKKNLIKACQVINFILIAVILMCYIYIFIHQDFALELMTSMYSYLGSSQPNKDARSIFIMIYLVFGVYLLIYAMISVGYVFAINKNKQQFYSKKSMIRLVCLLVANFAMGNFISFILLAIAIFWKDDLKEERKKQSKKKKDGYMLAPCFVQEYKILKKKKKTGQVSKEYYDREFMKLVKKSAEYFKDESNFKN